jgi:hypothetical protein
METIAGFPKIIRHEQDPEFDRDKQDVKDYEEGYDDSDPF